MIDFGNLRLMLLDRYTKEFPDCAENELMHFQLAMVWMEDALDLNNIQNVLIQELKQGNKNISKNELNAFAKALEWMTDALWNEEHTQDALNCFIPVRTYNIYLRKQLEGVKELITQNEELKKRCQTLENICNNMSNLSKKELRDLRKEEKYQSLLKEVQELRAKK